MVRALIFTQAHNSVDQALLEREVLEGYRDFTVLTDEQHIQDAKPPKEVKEGKDGKEKPEKKGKGGAQDYEPPNLPPKREAPGNTVINSDIAVLGETRIKGSVELKSILTFGSIKVS
jgi:hypothetical protein